MIYISIDYSKRFSESSFRLWDLETNSNLEISTELRKCDITMIFLKIMMNSSVQSGIWVSMTYFMTYWTMSTTVGLEYDAKIIWLWIYWWRTQFLSAIFIEVLEKDAFLPVANNGFNCLQVSFKIPINWIVKYPQEEWL